MILQEFDIEFASTKSKKSLEFMELIFELPQDNENQVETSTLKFQPCVRKKYIKTKANNNQIRSSNLLGNLAMHR